MKIDIRDMFEDYIDEDEIDMKNINAENLDIERIRRLTMDKIGNSASENRSKIVRFRKPVRIALIAAIISVLLIGSVSAAVIYSRMRIDTDLGEKTYTIGDGEISYSDVTAEINMLADPEAEGELMAFRVGYFPEFGSDYNCTVASLEETAAYELAAAEYLPKWGYSGLNDISSDDFEAFDALQAYADAPETHARLRELGLSDDDLANSYTHYAFSDGVRACTADLYSFHNFDNTYIFTDSLSVRQDTFNGMEAAYIELDASNFPEYDRLNCLVLTDEADKAYIVISGTDDFSVLENVASGLEVVHTGIKEVFTAEGFNGYLGGIGMG